MGFSEDPWLTNGLATNQASLEAHQEIMGGIV